MQNDQLTISLAVRDKKAAAAMQRALESLEGVELREPGPGRLGLLVLELGEDPETDFARVLQAVQSGAADDVILCAHDPDPQILIRAMRSDIKEFLPLPLDADEFAAALDRYRARGPRDRTQESDSGRVITVLGGKHGVGATTLAVNLAHKLARAESGQTALLDARLPVGEVPLFLDMECSYSWGDVVENLERFDGTFLSSIVAGHESGLSVLASPGGDERYANMLHEMDGDMLGQTMDALVHELAQAYANVVIDQDPGVNAAVLQQVERSDMVLVPLGLSLPCLAHVRQLLDAVRGMSEEQEAKIRLLVTRHMKDGDISVEEAEEILKKKISWLVPDDYPGTLSAINQGKPLSEAVPKSPVTRAINRIAYDLVRSHREEDGRKGKMSLLSVFKKRKAQDVFDLLPEVGAS